METRALYKIGLSRTLRQRFEMMQRASPLPLELQWWVHTEHPFALEDALHRLFREDHDHGEWYCLSRKQADWICALDDETVGKLIAARERARQMERRRESGGTSSG